MNPRVESAFAAGGGLITRQQALDLNVTPSAIAVLVRSGEWHPVRRGVYTTAETWSGLDGYRGRPRLVTRAAVSAMRRGFVLSHDSAALEYDLPLLPGREEFVHITRPGYSSAWTRYGIKHHYARHRDEQVVWIDGMRVLDLARTVADLAREHGFDAGVAAADRAMRLGTTRDQLISAYTPMEFWPHVTVVRDVVDAAHSSADSAIESVARNRLKALGLGPVEPQFPLLLGDRIVWLDFLMGTHAIETDGKLKLVPIELGGVATTSAHDVVWNQRKRDRDVCAEGLGVSRLVWNDLFGAHRRPAMEQVATEVAISHERYGDSIPAHLLRNAERIRRDWEGPGRRRAG